MGQPRTQPDKTFQVSLSHPTNAVLGRTPGQATLHSVAPTLRINDVSVTEGNDGTTNAVLTVSLSVPSWLPVNVNWATADWSAEAPSDYGVASGVINFAPGVTSQTLSVQVNGDLLNEAD